MQKHQYRIRKGGMAAAALACLFAASMEVRAAPILEQISMDETNSWNTVFGVFNISPFDTIEAFIVGDSASNGPFQGTGINLDDDFPPGVVDDFFGTVVNPSYSVVNGSVTDGAGSFQLFFAGDPIGTFNFDLLFWNGGVGGSFIEGFGLTFVDGIWDIEATTLNPRHPNDYNRRVPEPGTLALLGLGLLGMGIARRRRQT